MLEIYALSRPMPKHNTITGDAIGQTTHNKLNELEGKPVKPRKHIEQLSLNIAM